MTIASKEIATDVVSSSSGFLLLLGIEGRPLLQPLGLYQGVPGKMARLMMQASCHYQWKGVVDGC
jgi:hypothetical protein